ncbi:unnamed protein product [Callosobruchus maculatus]|uniref:Uncharacterized protein n=1 Tax=Callosobruchus maculatus TaxID=64391 RepID=A0A653D885_CALMS|nr:unnamed protein product [Callosobruchus maculatus]
MAVTVAINLEVSQSPSQIMYKTIATLAVAIFAFIQISNAAVPGAIDLRSMFPLGGPSYEIRSGNCTNATMSTLVYTEHVHKSRMPFTTREAEDRMDDAEKLNELKKKLKRYREQAYENKLVKKRTLKEKRKAEQKHKNKTKEDFEQVLKGDYRKKKQQLITMLLHVKSKKRYVVPK